MDKKKFMIIDGSSLLFRAFYALPLLTTKEGIYTNAVYGFLTMLYGAMEEARPDYLAVAFDKPGPTFRHKIYDDYKGTRSTPPAEINEQFPMVKEILEAMNISYLESDDYEADDIAGSLARLGEEEGLEVLLLTGDRDYLQLVTDSTKVMITKKGITETEVYDRDKIYEEYELSPDQLIDLKGLMGDSSDNIPGVPGIGEVIGKRLIKEFKTIEGVYENIDKVSGKKRKENLLENEDLAYLSRKLGRIICDLTMDRSLDDFLVREPLLDQLMPLFRKYEFTSLLNKYSEDYSMDQEEARVFPYEILDLEDFASYAKALEEAGAFYFKFIIKDHDYMENQALYIGLKIEDQVVKILDLMEHREEFIQVFRPVFENPGVKKRGHDLKPDLIVLFRMGIDIRPVDFDTKIGEYLINPSQTDYSVNDLSFHYFNHYGRDEEELLGKGKHKKNFLDISREEVFNYLSFYLELAEKARPKIRDIIQAQEMEKLYYEVELPLIRVLSSMEFYGFEVDSLALEELELKYSEEIEGLTREIHEIAGREFNVNSPKQLGEILFEDMGLPVIKKTKTGYSTSVDVLEKLEKESPIIGKVLRYRQIVKLKSTYIDGLLNLINEDTGRIHSTFNQTVTTTGRISSTEPNLQNIPIRTADGREIRKAFVAKEGSLLVDADYSQIELRVLAHISEDPKMIEAFREGEDIHRKTASEVFHVDFDKVDSQLRDSAKAVNFGIVYGISDYSLSQDLGISREEAKAYIDGYLDNYVRVRDYMEATKESGREEGYVKTLLNRRRYIPELKAKNFHTRAFGERIALNTPIQGSAADIIKMAMVRVYEELEKRKLKSKLILQVHDELIIETLVEEKEEVKLILREIMENIIELKVPLPVDLKTGGSWYETL